MSETETVSDSNKHADQQSPVTGLAAVKAAFTATVRERVALGSHSRWGGSDSVAVIEAVVEASEYDFAACRSFVEQVVNPSAFAQVLDKLPKDHPSHIRRPERGARSATSRDDL